uniref:Uncharacterized protein n=1 Tax=Globodera pallida TaxID=36090 RepID=A0A183CIL8_GLOPA
MISDHSENSNLCYRWTKSGKAHISGLRYVCAGCRKLRDAKRVAKETPLPTRKVVGGKWADDGPSQQHFCQPLERTKVQGQEERRKVQAELAFGLRENVASARVRIDARVAQNYSDRAEEERNQIRHTACGNSKATAQALYRAQTKRLMSVMTLHGLASVGRWLVNFQEANHQAGCEEETAVAIEDGRQQLNQPLAMTAEVDAGIEREKADVLAFLNTDFEEEQFVETLSRYFGRVGQLTGLNTPPKVEMDEEMQEDAVAEASFDESGIESIDEENIVPN